MCDGMTVDSTNDFVLEKQLCEHSSFELIAVICLFQRFPAENLLKPEGTSKWKCTEGDKQASVTFQVG